MSAGRAALRAEPALPARVQALDWPRAEAELDAQGWARFPGFLSASECSELAALYALDAPFRSRVVMARHGYGSGEYKYFAYPLPELVAVLRRHFYAQLVPLANRWAEALGGAHAYPQAHEHFVARCHQAGQARPTPLLLHYAAGDYNCLHQDLYGAQLFPMQVALLLSEPERDFRGGEFVLTEQRPRMQSRVMVVPLRQGDALVFAVQQRPVRGQRGVYRVNMRHGVSRLDAGQRTTLGLIFHDAS
jgi:hypothetical protein